MANHAAKIGTAAIARSGIIHHNPCLLAAIASLVVSLSLAAGHAAEPHKAQCPKSYRVTGPYGGQSTTMVVYKAYKEHTPEDRDWWITDEKIRYWWGYQRLLPPSNLVNCAGWVFHKLWNKGQYNIPADKFYTNVVFPHGVEVSRSDAKPGDIVVYLEPTESVAVRAKHIAVVVAAGSMSITIETKDGPESLFRTSLPFNLPKWASLDPLLRKYAQTAIYRVDPSKVKIEEVDAGECADDPPPAVAVNVAPRGRDDLPPRVTPPSELPPPPQSEPTPVPTDSPPIVIAEPPPPNAPPTAPPQTENPPGRQDAGAGGTTAAGGSAAAGGGQGTRTPAVPTPPPMQPLPPLPPVVIGPPAPPPPIRIDAPPPVPQPTPPPVQATTPPTQPTTPPPTVIASAQPATPSAGPPYKTHRLSQPMTPGGQCPAGTAFELCKFGPTNPPANGWVGCVFQRDENFVCTSLNKPPVCKCEQDRTGRVPPLSQLVAMAPAEPPAATAPALASTGATPLMMRTPSGGSHPNIVEPAAPPKAPPAAAAKSKDKKDKKTATASKHRPKAKREVRHSQPRERGPSQADVNSAAATAAAIGIIGGMAISGGFRGGHRGGGHHHGGGMRRGHH